MRSNVDRISAWLSLGLIEKQRPFFSKSSSSGLSSCDDKLVMVSL